MMDWIYRLVPMYINPEGCVIGGHHAIAYHWYMRDMWNIRMKLERELCLATMLEF